MGIQRETAQGTAEPCHQVVDLLGIALLALIQVRENRKVGIHRIEQPEVRDVGSGEIGKTLILLAASCRKLCAARRKQFHKAAESSPRRMRNRKVRFPGVPIDSASIASTDAKSYCASAIVVSHTKSSSR